MSTTAIRRQLGQIMVDEGFLSPAQLDAAIAVQHRTGKPLGQVLVETGLASAGAVANALAEQAGGLLRTEFGFSAGFRPAAPPPPIPQPEVRTIATPEEMARRGLVAELDALREQCTALMRGVSLLESELQRLRDSV